MFRLCAALALLSGPLFVAPARAAPPPVEAYGKLPGIEDISLSPSGLRYAFIAVIGEQRKLVAMNLDGSKVLFVSNVGSAKVVGVHWAGEDHLLVTVSKTVPLGMEFDVDKAEFQGVLAISLSTGKSFIVFEGHPQVAKVVYGQYGAAEIKGHWYGYFGGISYASRQEGTDFYLQHMWPDLYRVDLDSGAIDMAARGSEVADDWLVGPDGAVIASTTYDEKSAYWQVRTGGFGGRVLASGKSKLSEVGRLSRGRTPDTILIDRPAEQGSIFQELKLSGDSAGATPDEMADDAFTDPVTRLWIGTLTLKDQPVLDFFDPKIAARVRGALKAFPGLWVNLVSYTPDFGRMIVKTSGAGDSGTYWLVDMATHKADPLGYEYPPVGSDDVGTIEMVDWKAADGLALHGVLNLPPGRDPKNLPVVVMPHGGPEERDYPEFWWWSQLFASRGYAVFQPNFRGSSGYGIDFRNAGFGQWGRKMQTDISDGLAELVRQGIVDPKRACIVGWSYGGYAAQAGVTLQHGLYRCAVSMAGVSDLQGMLNYARDEAAGNATLSQRYWKAFMGVTSDWGNQVNPISPAKHADQADAPILLIHGKDDTVVPIDQSLEMAHALKAAGKPVELVTLAGADHWLLHEDTRLAMAQASLAFVLKYNPPDPEPATPPAAKP
jgi:acetyl esterase/lipase